MAAATTSAVAGQLSAKAQAFQPRALGARRPLRLARAVTCSAQKEDVVKHLSTAAAAAALAAVFGVVQVDAAYADIAGLTPCSESKAFAKRKKNEVKGLQKRLGQYEADSAPALALTATIEKTEARFDNYAKQGLLCGTDGLPHLIADPGFALKYGHAGDVFIPTFGFLYFAGWIGHSGRKYLMTVRSDAKPIEKEIIIDYPLALKCFREGLGWPLEVAAELKQGNLLEDDSKITTSPR